MPAIADLALDLPSSVAASVDEATQELSRFDTYATTLLGTGELAPMAAILLRTESVARGRVYQHPGVLGVLDGYAASLRRR